MPKCHDLIHAFHEHRIKACPETPLSAETQPYVAKQEAARFFRDSAVYVPWPEHGVTNCDQSPATFDLWKIFF